MTAELRKKAEACGRSFDDTKVYLGMTIVVAPTDAEAKDSLEEYAQHADLHGILASKSGYIGVDLSKYGLQDPLPNQKTNASQSAMAQYSSYKTRDLAPSSRWRAARSSWSGPRLGCVTRSSPGSTVPI